MSIKRIVAAVRKSHCLIEADNESNAVCVRAISPRAPVVTFDFVRWCERCQQSVILALIQKLN